MAEVEGEERSWPSSHGGGGGGGGRSSRAICCRELRLHEFPERYVILSADPDTPDHAFSIGRLDGQVEPLVENFSSVASSKVSTIFGVVGIIRLLAGTYVLLITSRKEVGSYLGFPVFNVTSMRVLLCNKALKHSTSQERKDEAYFMSLLKIIESTPGLYYSYEADLTLNLQRASKLTQERIHKSLWKQADPRFLWNRNLMEELIENKLDVFTIPVIQGSFKSVQLTFKGSPARVLLISRRCNRRLGTRMWRRGANLEGAAANFIETEQILEFEGFRASFLQIRGSIPLLWEQIVDLSYKPQLNIINHDETPKVVERHFHDLVQRYGETIAVDLTDKEGEEGQLSEAFSAAIQNLPYVRYVPFDFHHACAKGNFDNLQLLYNQIKDQVESQGYFLMKIDGQILLEQKGVIRSNCIDCLDRTNVTQSYLAQKSLNLQLQQLGAFSASECISTHTDIYEMFRILWAEHGDEISLGYTGTHALKGDLVRYGRQTLGGMIKDGISALTRYYLNNFHDGIRQDALDLISGHYTLSRSGSGRFQVNGIDSLPYLPVASALIMGGLTMTSFTLHQAVGRSTNPLASSVFWASLTAGVMALVKANGKQFCSRPRLCGLM
ncbi:phosphoinositide phosphatase SAC8-like isoform X1 [Zingiber officinale]|uniref:phosphoinositide phosphatase SAC8-like isoform X1 n=1 Tax=Zingiber officinale TaxID=94328 RepID=UPI001C4DC875|nr:phosphoinositide phosphatase SAC8-like isoform X1 [Zingiber officinale]